MIAGDVMIGLWLWTVVLLNVVLLFLAFTVFVEYSVRNQGWEIVTEVMVGIQESKLQSNMCHIMTAQDVQSRYLGTRLL